ncbi:genetic competence negative regulator [Sporolactobacillus laevolacticus]|jgi:adapter protein MecA 1/2|uniref:Adapter protein MecA n=1 Tax=Sporolactobacillus laevolacticus DSM 442 TaxID=1395513 RepID=V6IWM3_9BACL|nr:genetic competence negative regulator [Sporolactobacillus laevolacticus]EST11703.1 adaptor protein [Sporolactobacillus laevolacticus DSM 442]MDN3953631.1 genetic competence negative regulator [Sporolactobacillus laevolacticus]
MRLERLNGDRIKIFLTFDDLKERGITKEDMWHDLPRVEKLFRDMMLEADDELGFEASGPIDVEVFSLPAQGMVVIVSKGRNDRDDDSDEEFEDDDDFIQMQVTLDESQDVLYQFEQFDDVIALSKTLHDLNIKTGSLFLYENKYYIHFDENHLSDELDLETLVAVLAEFGNTSTITIYRLEEYGKLLMKDNAISEIYRYFIKAPHA